MEINDIINEQYKIPPFPKRTSQAMAYVPFQQDNPQTFSSAQGYVNGTMFPSLYKPFYGSKCGEPDD